jgi:hypothetical protein
MSKPEQKKFNIEILNAPDMKDVPANSRRFYSVQKIHARGMQTMINIIPQEIIDKLNELYKDINSHRSSLVETEHFAINIDDFSNVWYANINGGEEHLIWRVHSDENANLTYHEYSKNPQINPWTILTRKASKASFRPSVKKPKTEDKEVSNNE